MPQETTPVSCHRPACSQTIGPPPSPLQASLLSSPPAQTKPGCRVKLGPSLVRLICCSHTWLLTIRTSTSFNMFWYLPKSSKAFLPQPVVQHLPGRNDLLDWSKRNYLREHSKSSSSPSQCFRISEMLGVVLVHIDLTPLRMATCCC